ncbi:MAG: hypothetical protein OXJ37_05650 [Bryobacterales bacterium]|nr:hypothetical protein [Bryobacterales bacterium]MDE0624717.1 hypothetical protein [Bryobacterales bacterium]
MSSSSTDRAKRPKTESRLKPSEAFARHFGVEHGVDLPPPARVSYRPLVSGGEDSERPPR